MTHLRSWRASPSAAAVEGRRHGQIVEKGPRLRVRGKDRPVGPPGKILDHRPVGLGGRAEEQRLDAEAPEKLGEDRPRRILPVPDDLGIDGAQERRPRLRIPGGDEFLRIFPDQLFHGSPSSFAFASVGIPRSSSPRTA